MRWSNCFRACLLVFGLGLTTAAANAEVTKIVPGEHTVDNISLYSGIQYARVPGNSLLRSELKLDLLTPGTERPAPVVVFVLGSGWRATSRERLLPQMMAFAQAGYAVASIDYRGSGEASFPEPQKDVMAAVRFLRANASSLNLDPDRIALLGNSAGGHLAVSAALASGDDRFEDQRWTGVSSSVDAVIGIYPALYLDLGRPYYNQHVGVQLGVPGAEAPDGSEPMDLLSADDPPILLVHGTIDPLVPLSSSERFHEEASAAGHEVDLVVVEGIGHSFEDMLSVPSVRQAMIEFLDRTMK